MPGTKTLRLARFQSVGKFYTFSISGLFLSSGVLQVIDYNGILYFGMVCALNGIVAKHSLTANLIFLKGKRMNMRKLASSLLACAALGWAAVTPATSVASALLLDNTPTGTVTHETRGPATNGYPGVILTRIDVGGSNVSIDQFGVFGQQLGSGNVQFAVFDITQTRLYASGLIATATATGHQWYDSPIFALTLNANSTYYFGLVSDQNFDYDWSLDSPADSANGLTSPAGLSSGNNGNFGDIGNPVVFDYCCGVQQSVRIFGGAAAPEPASLALLGLGLAGLGFSRRKKS